MRKLTTSLSALSLLAASILQAESKVFDFDDPKGVNSISFTLDAPLEQINGSGKGVTGKVTFDPENPEATAGKIIIATDSLTVTNDKMRDHMLGEGWLDAKSHPEITFVAKSMRKVRTTKKGITADLTGTLTLKGVTKEIVVPVTLTYLPDMLSARTNGRAEGDLLVIRSNFSINRSEYGIKPGQNTDKVAEEIELRLAIAGAAPKS